MTCLCTCCHIYVASRFLVYQYCYLEKYAVVRIFSWPYDKTAVQYKRKGSVHFLQSKQKREYAKRTSYIFHYWHYTNYSTLFVQIGVACSHIELFLRWPAFSIGERGPDHRHSSCRHRRESCTHQCGISNLYLSLGKKLMKILITRAKFYQKI